MPTSVVTFGEIFYTSRMYGPVIALPILSPTCLDEAFIKAEIVSDTVSPGSLLVVVILEVVHNVLVDITEDQLPLRRSQD